MSLINDALKRASQTQKPKGDENPGTPLQPVDVPRRRSSSWILPVVCLLLLSFSIFLLWQWWTLRKSGSSAKADSRPTAPGSQVTVSAPPTQTPVTVAVSSPNNTPVQVANNNPPATAPKPPVAAPAYASATKTVVVQPRQIQETPEPVVTLVPSPGVPVASAKADQTAETTPVQPPVETVQPKVEYVQLKVPPGSFPELKLQGIFFRLNKPSVLINGRSLGVGDEIAGAKVEKIERQTVTVDFYGQKKVLGIQ